MKAGNTRTDSAIQDKVAERIRLNDLAKSFFILFISFNKLESYIG